MPVRHARSETRGRPPFCRRGRIGKNGSTRSHNASGSNAAAMPVNTTSPENHLLKVLLRALREPRAKGQTNSFLMNLQAGVTWRRDYTFSDVATDLAVISLDFDDQCRRFAEELEMRGYEAVPSSIFADGPSGDGADIFTVGYPGAVAIVGRSVLTPAERHWSSELISQPTFAFGRVAMTHDALQHFWCDLSVYAGASGSPVVENDQLVGIVTGQATAEASSTEAIKLPFAKVVKAAELFPLLEHQIGLERPH